MVGGISLIWAIPIHMSNSRPSKVLPPPHFSKMKALKGIRV